MKLTFKAVCLSALTASLCTLMAGLQPISPNFQRPGDDDAMRYIEPLIGGRWKAEGRWASGDPFGQEQEFEWGAGKKYVRSRTWTPGAGGGPPALRSEGVRAFSKDEGRALFWEFDAFGGITTGWIGVENENTFFYEYRYPVGGRVRTVRDLWTRIDDDHYRYKSGEFEEGRWGEMYLEGTLTRAPAPAECPCCGRPREGGE